MSLTDQTMRAAAWEAASAFQDWYVEMLLLSSRHAPIEEFVSYAATRLDNPVAVFASDGSVLARGGVFIGSIAGTIWERLESGSLEWGFYSRGDQERITRESMRATSPVRYRPTVDPTHEYLSALVRVRGSVVASLGLVDINAPITQGQVQTIAVIRDLLGIYLENNDLYLQLSKGSTSVIRELLEGSAVPADAVAYWLAERGIPAESSFRVFVALNPHQEDEPMPGPYLRELGNALQRAVLVPFEGSVVILMHADKDQTTAVASVERVISDIGLVCGYAPAVRNSMMLKTHYRQARMAAQMAAGQNCSTFGFVQCVRASLRKLVLSGDDPWLWCDPAVLSLWEQDEGGRELVRCLWAFLLHGQNIAAASRALFIHRNTLIYRLEKIQRELGISFDGIDEDQLLFLMTSCLTVMELEPTVNL